MINYFTKAIGRLIIQIAIYEPLNYFKLQEKSKRN